MAGVGYVDNTASKMECQARRSVANLSWRQIRNGCRAAIIVELVPTYSFDF